MEDKLFKKVYHQIKQTAKNKTLKRATFSHAQILRTYFWAVIHDRPIYWACKKKNWPIYYRRHQLPTASTMSRRLRTETIQKLLKQMEHSLIQRVPRSTCRWIDAKPLPIGGNSKDKDSRFGFGASSIAKGYKLYAIADKNQGFVRWTIKSMNKSESKIAHELIRTLDNQGYLIGDGQYDNNRLYDMVGRKSIQLVTPQRIRNAKGLGHRRHSLYRIRAMDLIKRPFGQSLIESRKSIKRMFGNLTCFAGGLKPLPHWVRTLFRVRLWVQAKMILYHTWRIYKYEQNCT
ncbi:hypothetical protein ES707_11577 [subsurface metagenome]